MSERRLRSRRKRRLIVAVVILDLVGAAALGVALIRSSSHPSEVHTPAPSLVALTRQPAVRLIRQASRVAAKPRKRPKVRPAQANTDPASAQTVAAPAGAQASFQRLAASLPGAGGLAIAPLGDGPAITFGSLQVGHAWSTMKVPVLSTLLSERHGLSPQQQAWATAALEHSDNSAAEALFAGLEQADGGRVGASAAVQDTLRRAGDQTTYVNTAPNSGGFTTWGQSEWSAGNEVIFYRSLARGCLLSPSDTQYVLGLMDQVQSDQRWGAGSAGFPVSLPLALKGGWGPEDGGSYLVRQSAIVGSGARGYVLSMLARPSDGSFATGAQMLTQIAAWVQRTVQVTARAPARCMP